jgi:hypothetical protein
MAAFMLAISAGGMVVGTELGRDSGKELLCTQSRLTGSSIQATERLSATQLPLVLFKKHGDACTSLLISPFVSATMESRTFSDFGIAFA